MLVASTVETQGESKGVVVLKVRVMETRLFTRLESAGGGSATH
jgi:hypothetical protein